MEPLFLVSLKILVHYKTQIPKIQIPNSHSPIHNSRFPIPNMSSLKLQITNKQILAIALPIAASIMVPQINFITNNIFLSGLGEKELGVAGLTGVFYLVFAVIGHGINNGLQALISRRAGENRPEEIGKIFKQGIIICLVIAAIAILIANTAGIWLLKQTIIDKEKYKLAESFLRIRIWGLPFLYLFQMHNGFLVGVNKSKYLIFGTALETIANILFDYSFIKGRLGMPNLGFNGAAYASVLAEIIGLLTVSFIINKIKLNKQFQLFKNIKFDKVNFYSILKQSSPIIAQFVISLASWEFFYIAIERLGNDDTNLAVSNSMRNVFGFLGCFAWAFASTTNTMVSNIIGQQKEDQVINLLKKIMKLSLLFAIVPVLIINLFPVQLLSIYGQSQAFIEKGIPVLRIVSTALLLMSISVIWLNAVSGTGNPRVTLLIELITIIFYCVYVYILL